MLMNTGDKPVYSKNGLLTTVAWSLDGKMTFALDGGIYISGAATQWLRDGLKIINKASETEQMAINAGNNGGVYFVPAFAGLAAPHWDSYARGTMLGITGGTTREHIVRATLEATAYQVKDNLDVMNLDSSIPIKILRADGGAVQNNFLIRHVPLSASETFRQLPVIAAGHRAGFYNKLGELVYSRPIMPQEMQKTVFSINRKTGTES